MAASKDLFNGVVIAGTGLYLLDIAWHGNILKLGSTLKEETGYIDFIVALFILGAIQSYGPTSKVVTALSLLTFTGLALKVMNKTTISSALANFANGNATIVETIKKLSGVE